MESHTSFRFKPDLEMEGIRPQPARRRTAASFLFSPLHKAYSRYPRRHRGLRRHSVPGFDVPQDEGAAPVYVIPQHDHRSVLDTVFALAGKDPRGAKD